MWQTHLVSSSKLLVSFFTYLVVVSTHFAVIFSTSFLIVRCFLAIRWLLRQAIGKLEEQGKVAVFPGSSIDEEGVKFAEEYSG
jgi:hypothetical protein